MRKYLFTALAIMLMLLAAVSISSAETKNWGPYEVEILNEDDNTVRIVKYNLQKKDAGKTEIDLEIPSEMGEYVVTEIGPGAFINQQRLRTVVIPEGVTTIGSQAFSGCDGIKAFKFPDSLVSIGNKAFSNCKQLKKAKLPGTIQEIGDNPFALCDNLAEIILDGDSEIFEVRDGMLIEKAENKLITYLQNSHGESFSLPEDIKIIGRIAFWECKELQEVILPEGLETIQESAFKSCTGIQSISLPASVHLIENRSFAECTSLTEFTIPDSLIDVTGNPFVGCKNLQKIHLSENHPTLMLRDGTLMDKRTLALLCYPYVRQDEEFTVPEGTLEIGPSAFESCRNR